MQNSAHIQTIIKILNIFPCEKWPIRHLFVYNTYHMSTRCKKYEGKPTYSINADMDRCGHRRCRCIPQPIA